ncbi:MAG: calcium-binding protein [Pseudomonadota bacterium]
MLGLMGLFSLLVAGSTVGSLMMDDTETEIEREDDVAGPEQTNAPNLLASVLDGTPLAGGAGDDLLQGDLADDLINGGAGNDLVDGGDGADQIWGGHGDDGLLGGDGFDELIGENGNDLLAGETGADGLFGQNGDDVLSGGHGDDRLVGGAGDDVLAGDAGNDSLQGVAGEDLMIGGAGHDTLMGGTGDDWLVGGDLVQEGPDLAEEIADQIETVLDAALDPVLGVVAGVSPDLLRAEHETEEEQDEDALPELVDDDVVDHLNAGSGDDVLIGGHADTLHGGQGADTFMLDIRQSGPPAQVMDFSQDDGLVLIHDDDGPPAEVTVQVSTDNPNMFEITADGDLVANVIAPDGLSAADVELLAYAQVQQLLAAQVG